MLPGPDAVPPRRPAHARGTTWEDLQVENTLISSTCKKSALSLQVIDFVLFFSP